MFQPNFGLGPNDNRNMFIQMMNNMMNLNRSNNLNNINDNNTNNENNNTNNNNNMNLNMNRIMNIMPINSNMMNPMMNPIPMNMMNPMGMPLNNNMPGINFMNNLFMFPGFIGNIESISLEPKDIKRKEGLDVKCDIDRILHSNHELTIKNKDLQTIINYIPYTTIEDEPTKLKDGDPRCVICLADFEIGQKVSALPCCHSFHTKCLDEWIIRNAKCPICKFEITLKNLIGEDLIKQYMIKIEEERKEKERIEKERIEKERKESFVSFVHL